MTKRSTPLLALFACLIITQIAVAQGPVIHTNVVVAEGEKFAMPNEDGWVLTRQDDSWASHSYGGMWVTHGALLGIAHGIDGAVATQEVTIKEAGDYKVWSKYQSMPYFDYQHSVQIVQNGKTVYSHIYGKMDGKRFYSFAGAYKSEPIAQCWFPWGVDHDAAEAPEKTAALAAGPATISLISTTAGERPADRMVDFVLLTSNTDNNYRGYEPYQAGSPFTYEALAATELYIRFKNDTAAEVSLSARKRVGHYQPVYSGWTKELVSAAAGQWSDWYNFGPDLNLLHDEGIHFTVEGATAIPIQFALDAAGKTVVGDVTVANGDPVVIPTEITWDRTAVIKTSEQHAREIIESCRNDWRTANGGTKPQQIAYIGGLVNGAAWCDELKDAVGYNTVLPDKYDHLDVHGYHCHARGEEQLRVIHKETTDPASQLVISFGDEIGLGEIDFEDEELQKKFPAWLKKKGISREDLGVPVEQAKLTRDGDARLSWYSTLFQEEEIFAKFRKETEFTRELFGDQVFTGANYSPHHLALCYGPVYQWVDLFKHQGMSMFWSEDYIFSVPEAPQILSWMMATARCGVKYHDLPIHMYIMPHAPAQAPEYLRRNMVFTVGAGATQINSFLIGPQENTTENYVSWNRREQYRIVHEAIYDSAEAESYLVGAKIRPAHVALVISKATDYNESRLFVDSKKDPFLARSDNAPETINQIICRKDQQMLYLALRHAQVGVELITEDDIVDIGLDKFDVVYFAGEWIDHRVVPLLDQWVQDGGVLYATAGLGHLNEFNEPDPAMLNLLGLDRVETDKDLYVIRTLLELPLVEPIDTINLSGIKIPAVGMRQKLYQNDATVLATWNDGSAAATIRTHGKGKAIAVGTLAGNTYMKSGVRQVPFARGGNKNLYNPTGFKIGQILLTQLGVHTANISKEVDCGNPYVEGIVFDSDRGAVLTLVNWTNDAKLEGLDIKLKLPFKPRHARSVEQQKNVSVSYADGIATITTDLTEADYILLPR